MKEKRVLMIVVASLLLVLPYASVRDVSAAEVFQEDFNDGNLHGWGFMASSNFTAYEHAAGDYALHSGSSSSIGQYAWCNTTALSDGTWSVDIFSPLPNDSTTRLYFYMNGNFQEPFGYFIEIKEDTGNPSLRLCKDDNGTAYLLGLFIFSSYWHHTWTHFDMTRDSSTGEINVFVNGTHTIQDFDTSFNHTEKVLFHNFKGGPLGFRVIVGLMLDNLAINDTITLEEPDDSTTTTEEEATSTASDTSGTTGTGGGTPLNPLLLAAVGGGVVVLLVVVLLVKRR
jgi:hypothetical protein